MVDSRSSIVVRCYRLDKKSALEEFTFEPSAIRVPESPRKVSLDRALAGEASVRENAVIGLKLACWCREVYIGRGSWPLCQPCKEFSEHCCKRMPLLRLVCVRSTSKIA